MKKLIRWVEIPAENFERAVDFYSIILSTELEVISSEQEQMACFPNGEGAISKASDFKPSKDGALVSFDTNGQLEKVLEKVQQNGGKTIQGKTKIEAEGFGFFALILDSEGNKIGLYED